MAPTRFRWQFPVRRPKATLVTFLAVTGALFFVGKTLNHHTQLFDLVRKQDPSMQRWLDFHASFGKERSAIITLTANPHRDTTTTDVEDTERLDRFRDFFQKSLGATAVVMGVKDKNRRLLFVSYNPDDTTDEEMQSKLGKARQRWESEVQKTRRADQSGDSAESEESAIKMGGELFLRHEVHSSVEKWLAFMPWLLALLALFIFLGGGGLRALVLTVVVFGSSLTAIMASSRVLGGRMDLDATFPAALGLFFSIFFVRRLLDSIAMAKPGAKEKRVGTALFRSVGPIILSAGIIAICLVGMGGSRFPGVRRPALIAAVGVLFASIASITAAPALLKLWPGKWNERPSKQSKLSRWTRTAGKPFVMKPLPWLVLLFVVFVAGSIWSLYSPISHGLLFSSSDLKTLIRGSNEKDKTGRAVSLSLVIQAGNPTQLASRETRDSLNKLREELQKHPKIMGVIFPESFRAHRADTSAASENIDSARSGERDNIKAGMDRGQNPEVIFAGDLNARLVILAKCKSTDEISGLARWIETTSVKALPDDLSSHTTGALVFAAAAADETAKAYLVGLVRFLGMLLLLIIAISKDPRLGLTAVTPPVATLVILGVLIGALFQSVHMVTAQALILVAAWCSVDALDALLKTARLRVSPPGTTPEVTAPSLRSSLLLAPFVAIAGLYCRSPFFAQGGLTGGLGLAIGSLFSALLIPMMLNYMPAARLHGPLWEHIKKKKRKKKKIRKRAKTSYKENQVPEPKRGSNG